MPRKLPLALRQLMISTLLHLAGPTVPLHAAPAPQAQLQAAPAAPWPLWFHGIRAITTHEHLAAWLGSAQGLIDTPLRLVLNPDPAHPGRLRLELQGGGLGLEQAARYAAPLGAYRDHLHALAEQAGEPDPAAAAARVLNLERRLAALQAGDGGPAQTVAAHALPSGLDWQSFLAAAKVPAGTPLHLPEPAQVAALSRLLADVPLDDWKLYLRLRSVERLGNPPLTADGRRMAQTVHQALGLWQVRMAQLGGAVAPAGPTLVKHPVGRSRGLGAGVQ